MQLILGEKLQRRLLAKVLPPRFKKPVQPTEDEETCLIVPRMMLGGNSYEGAICSLRGIRLGP